MKIKRSEYEELVAANERMGARLAELEELARLRFILSYSKIDGTLQKLSDTSLEEWVKARTRNAGSYILSGSFLIQLKTPPPTGYELFLTRKYGASTSPNYREGVAQADEIDPPYNVINRIELKEEL